MKVTKDSIAFSKPRDSIYIFLKNHAGNVVTSRSYAWVIIYVQNAPIVWYPKKQNKTESETFGSEFVALQIFKEVVVDLCYKLWMFEVLLGGP